MNRHWTDDDLLNALYGIGPEDGHLKECAECRGRWSELHARRSDLTKAPDLSSDFLAAQRRSIYRKLDRAPRRMVQIAPAFVALLMLVIGLFLVRPSGSPSTPASTEPGISDAQLYSDISSMMQNPEPEAGKPIHALFETN